MEVKDILEKIRQPKDAPREYYLAVEIGFKLVKSALWVIDAGQINILSVGSIQTWQEESAIVEAVDASLSMAMAEFSPAEGEKEPNKVIFGLPDDWVEGEKIQPEKLQILKEISQKMEFEPVGFVVTTEAINHYLKETEGVPPTAILIGLTARRIFVTLLRLGKILPTQAVDRSGNLGDDVLEGLSRYSQDEDFPSRILFYDGQEDLEKARQDLVAYPWQSGDQKITFLHLPKTEILPSDFDIKAVAIAGGKEVARSAGIEVTAAKSSEETALPADHPPPSQPQKAPAAAEASNFVPVDFGFVKDRDIAKVSPRPASPVTPAVVPPAAFSPVAPPTTPSTLSPTDPLPTPAPVQKNRSRLKISPNFLSKVNIPKPTLPKVALAGKPAVVAAVVGGVILLLLAGAGLAYWRLPKANVVLHLEPQILEDQFEVILDPELSVASLDDLSLPGQALATDIEGSKSAPATGTKLTGEPAKGEVTIYNDTAQKKTFPAGTVLTSSAGLEFTLDTAVEIASKSGNAADSQPGQAVVGVTAAEIGSDSNLASGTEFSVANFSKADYLAKNNTAFAGGSSREIAVVAAADRTELLENLTAELEAQVVDQLRSQVSAGQTLIEESIQSTVADQEFSAVVGDEADSVTLSLSLACTGLAFSEEEMNQLVEGLIRDKVPSGFEYRRDASSTSFALQKITKDGQAVFEVGLKASLLPQVDFNQVKAYLVGKYPMIGKTYLENLPNIATADIVITPPLPAKLLTFPRRPENITIATQID